MTRKQERIRKRLWRRIQEIQDNTRFWVLYRALVIKNDFYWISASDYISFTYSKLNARKDLFIRFEKDARDRVLNTPLLINN